MLKKSNRLYKYVAVIAGLLILDILGVFAYFFELDYEKLFRYPLEGDIVSYVRARKQNIKAKDETFQMPQPINYYNYTFIHQRKCDVIESSSRPQLTILVKSALLNTQKRDAIRRTWGYEQRFSDVNVRRAFILGASVDQQLMADIAAEAHQYRDIIQADFIDSYYNNTIKTMMAIRWVMDHCHRGHYYLFVDDDYYVSLKNLLRFVAYPALYPENAMTLNSRWEYKAQNERLFAGFVFRSRPLRQKFSKWYVSLKEYPYNKWPPYVTAGAFVLSRDALVNLYYASQYTKHFRFDDIYLGLVALKANIPLTHCGQFYFRRPPYHGPESYRFIVASHGFNEPLELERIWNECRSANYA
uniref:Hexosyltransferase n=1 Tax=Glossina austeni TaxID=7395 RepID=A0A1A9V177_GLOAU